MNLARQRPWWLALAVAASSCDCGASSHPATDAGKDGGRDAGVDGGLRDLGVDAGRRDGAGADAGDGGALTVFPDGWERVPYLPDECDAWRPIDPARSVAALRWEPCMPSVPGCEQVVVDWRDRDNAGGALRVHEQTRGNAGHIFFVRPTDAGNYDETILATLDGAPVAAWRSRMPNGRPWSVACPGGAAAVSRPSAVNEIAIVHVMPVAADATRDVVLVEPIDRMNATTTPFARLTLAELRAESNSLYIAELDADNVVFGCGAGSLVIASHAGGPFRQLTGATTTGDLGAALQTLWHSTVYYSAPPYPRGLGWDRLRRVRLPDGVPETFRERSDGHIGGLRIDGEWATWAEYPDDGPIDGVPDHLELHAARTHDSDDFAAWEPAVMFVSVFPNDFPLSDPILANGRLAYWVSPFTLELLDLASRQRVRVPAPPDMLWGQLAHLGPEYLFVTVALLGGPIPQVGLRRFRIAELTGWEPLP